MSRQALVCLLAWAASAWAVDDPAFQLLQDAEKVKVYSRKPGHCASSGADVLFVVENKTREKLELKMELLDLKVKNRLTVLLEPSGSTSVLSLVPEAEMCRLKLVGLQVKSVGEAAGSPAALPASDAAPLPGTPPDRDDPKGAEPPSGSGT